MTPPLEPRHKLQLDRDKPLSSAMIDAFDGVLQHAAACAEAARQDAARATHEQRKALRRARALLRLLKPHLGDDFDELHEPLRAQLRRTSSTRDLDVLGQTLHELPKARKPKEARDREAVAALILEALHQRDAGLARAALEQDRELLQTLRFDLTQALPQAYGWEDVALGLRASYARARRALKAARTWPRTWRDEQVHDLRKRVKELRYQLELLSGRLEHAPLLQAHEALAALAEQLGQVTDQMLLRDLILKLSPRLAHDPRRLIEHLEELIALEVERALKASDRALSRRPGRATRDLLAPVLPLGEGPPPARPASKRAASKRAASKQAASKRGQAGPGLVRRDALDEES